MLMVLLFDYDCSAIAFTQDNKGRTTAYMAVQSNNVSGLRLLMDRFPDIYELVDHQQRNVVHYAAFLAWPEALELLYKEDIRFFYVRNKRDQDGNTPLHLLAKSLKDIPPLFSNALGWVNKKLQHEARQRVFNNEGLTAADIAHSYKTDELDPLQELDRNWFLMKLVPRGRKIQLSLPGLEDQKSYIRTKIENQRAHFPQYHRDLARDHAVVAALIATVSFTVGLAVPGGFNQTTGSAYEGTAIFTKTKKATAFQAFLVSDAVALTSSFYSILVYFLIALIHLRRLESRLLFWAIITNSISMVALMVAFMAGTYSILWPSTGLCVFVLLLCSAFMIVAARLFFYTLVQHIKMYREASTMDKSIIQ